MFCPHAREAAGHSAPSRPQGAEKKAAVEGRQVTNCCPDSVGERVLAGGWPLARVAELVEGVRGPRGHRGSL